MESHVQNREKSVLCSTVLELCNVLFHALKKYYQQLLQNKMINMLKCQSGSLHLPQASVFPILAASDGIFKLVRSPGSDSMESIPPAHIAWRAGTTTLFLLVSQPPQIVLKFQQCVFKLRATTESTIKEGVIVGLSVECLWCCTEHLICDVVYVGQKKLVCWYYCRL